MPRGTLAALTPVLKPVQRFKPRSDGREWRLPRHWLPVGVSPVIPASRYEAMHESSWMESWILPTLWNLGDMNIQDVPGPDGGLGAPEVEVRVSPGEIAKVLWCGPSGRAWRIPHDWLRRRVKLPGSEGVLRNNLPLDIAEAFANKIVTVNYHPGSLCCLCLQIFCRQHMAVQGTGHSKDC